MKRVEERISFLSSHNLCSNVKGLTDLFMQEGGGWYFIVKFLTSNSVMLHENKDVLLDVLFYSSGNFSIYISIYFLFMLGIAYRLIPV